MLKKSDLLQRIADLEARVSALEKPKPEPSTEPVDKTNQVLSASPANNSVVFRVLGVASSIRLVRAINLTGVLESLVGLAKFFM